MKIDFKKQLKHLYNASAKTPVLVDVPQMNYLMVDGAGDPNNSSSYARALQILYSVSYAAKFRIKKSDGGIDYVVPPLEGHWWTSDPANYSRTDREDWRWTMMIMQPECVTKDVLNFSLEKAREKLDEPIDDVRLESMVEGRVAQIMHIGPYADEEPTIQHLHRFVKESGLTLRDKHHEIYLSDPRRAKPEKMKTILRHPVE